MTPCWVNIKKKKLPTPFSRQNDVDSPIDVRRTVLLAVFIPGVVKSPLMPGTDARSRRDRIILLHIAHARDIHARKRASSSLSFPSQVREKRERETGGSSSLPSERAICMQRPSSSGKRRSGYKQRDAPPIRRWNHGGIAHVYARVHAQYAARVHRPHAPSGSGRSTRQSYQRDSRRRMGHATPPIVPTGSIYRRSLHSIWPALENPPRRYGAPLVLSPLHLPRSPSNFLVNQLYIDIPTDLYIYPRNIWILIAIRHWLSPHGIHMRPRKRARP